MKHTMLGRVKAYLAVRRALGYQLLGEGGYLLHFARYADRGGHRGPPSKDLMLRWARLSRQAKRSTWARRLQIVGAFAKYWQALEPKTQLAPRHVFGPRSPRPTPYLYSPAQMRVLLRRARRLTGARQPPTYATLLGLLACTGLRISEALRLRVSEVDFSQGLLRVSPSKYHKVRWLPLHPTTRPRLTPLRALPPALLPESRTLFRGQRRRSTRPWHGRKTLWSTPSGTGGTAAATPP